MSSMCFYNMNNSNNILLKESKTEVKETPTPIHGLCNELCLCCNIETQYNIECHQCRFHLYHHQQIEDVSDPLLENQEYEESNINHKIKISIPDSAKTMQIMQINCTIIEILKLL